MSDRSWVHGVHAVRWLLKQHPERVRVLYVQDRREDARAAEVFALARAAGIEPKRIEGRRLDEWTGGAAHQGIAAEVQPSRSLNESELETLLDQLTEPALLLLLDGVQDPHNLGACLRTANACGVHAVVVPRDRAVGLTPTVRKVAAGAAELVPLVTVTNLARCMRTLKERDLWLIGADAGAERTTFETELKGAIGFVMGGEGAGLRRLTREVCDLVVRLPMRSGVESLNVSVATGMLLYEALRQRTKSPATGRDTL